MEHIQITAVLKQTKENAFIHHITVELIASGWRPKLKWRRKGLDESLGKRLINEFKHNSTDVASVSGNPNNEQKLE